jgi:serine/threonine protein kinase
MDILAKEQLSLLDGSLSLSGARVALSRHGLCVFAKTSTLESLEPTLLEETKVLRARNEDVCLPLLIRQHFLDAVSFEQSTSDLIQGGRRLLLIEVCSMGDLESLLCSMTPCRRVPVAVVVRLLHGIATGLDFLHLKRIAHLALRLDHVLVDAHARTRLAGLAHARFFPFSLSKSNTIAYLQGLDKNFTPPEVK